MGTNPPVFGIDRRNMIRNSPAAGHLRWLVREVAPVSILTAGSYAVIFGLCATAPILNSVIHP
jgi:hypothetical protein